MVDAAQNARKQAAAHHHQIGGRPLPGTQVALELHGAPLTPRLLKNGLHVRPRKVEKSRPLLVDTPPTQDGSTDGSTCARNEVSQFYL